MIISAVKIAYGAIKKHKVRAGLTVLGLLVGVSAIIAVLNIGQALKGFVLDQVSMLGTDYINVEIKVPSTSHTSSENAMGLAQGVSITTLTSEDAKAVAELPNIKDYFAAQIGQAVVSYESENKTATLWGVSPVFFSLFNTDIAEGRPFTDEEDKSQARVCVIGYGLKEKLFGDREALGRRLNVGNKKFEVIGVAEKQGAAFFMDMDSNVYMPVQTLQKQVLGVDYIQFFLAYLKDSSRADSTAREIESLLRERHNINDPKKDDFAVTTQKEAQKMLDTITQAITLLLTAIAAVSLLVGGVGIMNIMYVSVSERTYEIGLRKAVGATEKNIFWQFLAESVFLCFLGGVFGVIFGTTLSFLAVFIAKNFGFDVGLTFSWFGVLIGVGFASLVGLIFGVFPAKQAAKMQPIEALREAG